METLEQIIKNIETHHEEEPTHGLDCACLDKSIAQIRKITTVSNDKAQRRIDYVLRMACENRVTRFRQD